MSRKKLFIENFFVYGLTGVIGKAIPFVMLPIITRLVPDTSIYGLSDVLHVLISFGVAFAVLGMYDAMFRMFFEKDEEEFKKKVCYSALSIVWKSSLAISIFVIIFSKSISTIFLDSDKYYMWVIFCGVQIFFQSLDSIIAAPTRMQNKRKVYLTLSIVNPVISYAVSVPLIIFVDPLIGLMFGGFVTVFSKLIIFSFLNKKWFAKVQFDRKLSSELLKIGLPLVPVFLIYWIFNSFDRIMISNMLGVEYNGIYAVGSKVSQVSQLIYMAFAGGWQYFAFSTMKDKDQVKLITNVFEKLALISFISFLIITPFMKLIFELLFSGEYIKGYIVTPYLYISPLLLMLFQTAGQQLLTIKKTYFIPITLSLGAIVNVVLNYILIPLIGIEGAAISTLFGYILSVLLVSVVVSKMKLLSLSKKFIFISFTMILYVFLLIFNKNFFVLLSFSFLILIVILFFERDSIRKIFRIGMKGENNGKN